MKSTQTKKQLFLEIVRFLIVGGTATVVDYLIAYLFISLILPPEIIGERFSIVLSTAMGFCAGLIVNWLLSISFVFLNVTDKEKSRSKKSFVIFTIIGIFGLAITEIGMLILNKFLPTITLFNSTLFIGEQWKWWLSKVIMTCIVLVWNYVGRKLFVFK